MRLTVAEIALVLIAVDLAGATAILRRRAGREADRDARGRRAFNHARATAPLGPEDPGPERAILQAIAWGFARHPCGCQENYGREPRWERCDEHAAKAVDDEIAGWRI